MKPASGPEEELASTKCLLSKCHTTVAQVYHYTMLKKKKKETQTNVLALKSGAHHFNLQPFTWFAAAADLTTSY